MTTVQPRKKNGKGELPFHLTPEVTPPRRKRGGIETLLAESAPKRKKKPEVVFEAPLETPPKRKRKTTLEKIADETAQLRSEVRTKPARLLNVLEIPEVEEDTTEVCLIGTGPLLANHFPGKALEMIVRKQVGETVAKDHRDIDAEFNARIVRCGREYGFNVLTFKNAIIDAVRNLKKSGSGLTKALLQSNIYIHSDGIHEDKFEVAGRVFSVRTPVIRLITDPPTMRADYVRLAGIGSPADVRFRPEYPVGWRVKLKISYNGQALTQDQLYNLCKFAGRGGVGDWRPERGGWAGTFRLAGKNETW
jgi:hypothetical protein